MRLRAKAESVNDTHSIGRILWCTYRGPHVIRLAESLSRVHGE